MSGPAWSEAFDPDLLAMVAALPLPKPTRSWAWGGSTGKGVKVAIVDSGVDAQHPRVLGLAGMVTIELDPEGEPVVIEGPHHDRVGHGTACAGIIRQIAPDAEIYSVQVLGDNLKGKGKVFCAGIEWALEAGMDVVSMSLSTRSDQWFGRLHDLADAAYFQNTVLVCAANNVPGPTYPSQFASVVSVAARVGHDPLTLAYNPRPPVEYGACGIDLEVAWQGDGTIVATGNSFATPHIAGMVALLLAKHPGLTSFQVKSVLQALAENTE